MTAAEQKPGRAGNPAGHKHRRNGMSESEDVIRKKREIYEKLQRLAQGTGNKDEAEAARLAMKRLEETYGAGVRAYAEAAVKAGAVDIRYKDKYEDQLIRSIGYWLDLEVWTMQNYNPVTDRGHKIKVLRVKGDKALCMLAQDLFELHRGDLAQLLLYYTAGFVSGFAPDMRKNPKEKSGKSTISDEELAAVDAGAQAGRKRAHNVPLHRLASGER